MTITPDTLDTMRADAARHAAAQAEVPSCDYSHDITGPVDHNATWIFAEVIVESGMGCPINLSAPAAIVDVTRPEAFALAIVAARSAVPALASDVLTLCAEVERLQALVAHAHRPTDDPCPGSRGW